MFAMASAQTLCSLLCSISKAFVRSIHSIFYLFAARVVADKLLEVIQRHKLENKTASFVTDTCSVMKAAWNLLATDMPMLMSFGCQAHVWSLFLKDVCDMPAVGPTISTRSSVQPEMCFCNKVKRVCTRDLERQKSQLCMMIPAAMPSRQAVIASILTGYGKAMPGSIFMRTSSRVETCKMRYNHASTISSQVLHVHPW